MTSFNQMKSGVMPILIASTAALLLSACSGDKNSSSGSSTPSEEPTVVEDSVRGVVVVPVQTTTLSPKLSPARAAGTGNACVNIPNGYAALANATITYIDASGKETTTSISTDNCGAFGVSPDDTIVKLSFAAPGYRAVTTDVSVFKVGNAKYQVVSTIPTTSSYIISGLTLNSDGSLSFVVEDNVTNKAVIGIPENAFSLTENGVAKTFSSVTYRSSASASKETVLTIDASGSMSSNYVYETNGSNIVDQYGKRMNRRDLTALASYDFISNYPSTDQLAVTIFDSSIYFYDNTYLNSMSIANQNGDSVDLGYSADGFETDRKKSEFIIDIYNQNSSINSGTGKIAAFDYTGFFPSYGGGTAVYNALYTSVEKLVELNSSNSQFVILMTDGDSFDDTITVQDAIDYAKQNGVITNTIGFSGGNSIVLQDIATQTGGTFYEANGLDIADAFSAAQSAIDYAYKGVYNTATTTGDAVDINLTLNHTGLTVSKTLLTTK